MSSYEDYFKLSYSKSKQGKREYIHYYSILLVSFIILVTFYSLQTVEIEEQSTSGGDGCTANVISLGTTLGSVQNFPGSGNCLVNFDTVVNTTDYINYKMTILYDDSDTTDPYRHRVTFDTSYTVLGGASVKFQSATSIDLSGQKISEIDLNSFVKCGAIGGPSKSTASLGCCSSTTSGLTPEYAAPNNEPSTFSDSTCPRILDIQRIPELLYKFDPVLQKVTSATSRQDIANKLISSIGSAKEEVCIVAEAAKTYTCKRKIPVSGYTVFITSITLLSSMMSFLGIVYASLFGPAAEPADEDEDEPNKENLGKSEVGLTAAKSAGQTEVKSSV